jgi:hypothetical protein
MSVLDLYVDESGVDLNKSKIIDIQAECKSCGSDECINDSFSNKKELMEHLRKYAKWDGSPNIEV